MKGNRPFVSTIAPIIVMLLLKCPDAIGVIGKEDYEACCYDLGWNVGHSESLGEKRHQNGVQCHCCRGHHKIWFRR